MERTTIQTKNTVKTVPLRQKRNIDSADQSLLQGLPLRHCQQDTAAAPVQDWVASLIWLRIPLLLLGVIGALGLLACYNARFAQWTGLIHWPDAWVSIVFLGIAGCVFLLLLAECIFVHVTRYIRLIRRKRNPGRMNWRSR